MSLTMRGWDVKIANIRSLEMFQAHPKWEMSVYDKDDRAAGVSLLKTPSTLPYNDLRRLGRLGP